MNRSFLLIVALLSTLSMLCAEQTDTRAQIFDHRFRTLRVMVDNNDMVQPVLILGSNQHVTISFDEIGDERSWLRYRLIHCNRDWQPSGLVDSEFLNGFNEAEVTDYAFSRATLTHYVNYSITLPNASIEPLVSGNYLLQVYDEEDPDVTLLQARFYVSEGSMKLSGAVSSITDIDFNQRHQQVEILADYDRVPVADPYRDLTVIVEQNGRPDMTRIPAAPLKVIGSKLYYEHNRDLIFPAGNEYRRFETISTRFRPMGVSDITYFGNRYNYILYTDLPRENYIYDQTQHGRFRIRNYDSDLPDTEADYVGVTFTLAIPELESGDIFIDGDFTGRLLGPESRMTYDRVAGVYELTTFLKQGAYNYQYLYVPEGSTIGSTAEIEGDFAPTDNEYFIRLYHRRPSDRYDRLTAVMTLFAN